VEVKQITSAIETFHQEMSILRDGLRDVTERLQPLQEAVEGVLEG
jgi:hypothetical protein